MKHATLLAVAALIALLLPCYAPALDLPWADSVLTILPNNPAPTDTISITLSGDWPNDCIPGDAEVYRQTTNLYFDVLDYSVWSTCFPLPTPYSIGPATGVIPAGTYRAYVSVIEVDEIFGTRTRTQGPDFVGTFTVAQPGDTDGNGCVDVFDVIAVVTAFGSAPGQPTWRAGCDVDHDNDVDVFDVITVVSHFGSC